MRDFARSSVVKLLPRVAGIVATMISLRWIWIYTATDYRAHLRAPMLIVAVSLLSYATLLLLRKPWAVRSSAAITLLGAVGLIWFQVSSGLWNWYLVVATTFFSVYGVALIWAMRSARQPTITR